MREQFPGASVSHVPLFKLETSDSQSFPTLVADSGTIDRPVREPRSTTATGLNSAGPRSHQTPHVVEGASGICQPRTAPAADARSQWWFVVLVDALEAELGARSNDPSSLLLAPHVVQRTDRHEKTAGSLPGTWPFALARCHRQACTGTPPTTEVGLDSVIPRCTDVSLTRLAVPASRVQLLLSAPGPGSRE